MHAFVIFFLLSTVQFLGQRDASTDQCQAGQGQHQPHVECDQRRSAKKKKKKKT